ncbi:hypothetical protein AN641_04380 [Candidatus Epulonipiscioides gigas]|nr:hypothetical protein AN641_04380 [Epulopiscium sp. SCG-C07WGA-EpuloA2]
MKLTKKLIAIINCIATLTIPAFGMESNFVTGTVTSGTEQFNETLNKTRINSTEEIEWQQIAVGSQGGADSSFFHPTDPNYVYISQNMKTTYMSRDNMTSVDTWETISDEDSNGNLTSISQVYQMKFSLQDENYGIASNSSGLFVTYDKGKNWRPFAEHQFSHEYKYLVPISALALDPTNHDIIYAGAGGFWKNKDPRTNKKRYKTAPKGTMGVIYKSVDGGETWIANKTGLPENAEIGQIFIHPKNLNTLYVATSHGNFISRDAGATYEPINDGLEDPISGEVYIRDLAFHYDEATEQVMLVTATLTIWDKDENNVLTHTSGGVYKSVDEGKTWQSLNDGLMVEYAPFADPSVIGHGQGYNTGIRNWFGIKSKPETPKEIIPPEYVLPSFREVEINPVNPNILYAVNCGRKENSIEPEGIWISEDGGKNWFISTRIGEGYQEDATYWKEQYAPSDVDLTELNVSVGGEKDWSWMFDDKYPMLAYQYLAISPDGKTLITHVFKSRIVSRDGGRTWEQVDSIEVEHDIWIGRGNSNVPGRSVFTNPHTDKVYFLSGETGLWRVNEEVDYAHIDTKAVPMERIDIENEVSCPGSAIAFDPHNQEIIYTIPHRLNYYGKFMKSTNGGVDWEEVSTIFDVKDTGSICAYTLIIDKNTSGVMYFAMPKNIINDIEEGFNMKDDQFGVYKTTDGGITWTLMNNGFNSYVADINALAFSNDHKTIYAASMGANGGLYKSTDGSQNWVKMQLPKGVHSVNDIKVTKSGRMVISTGFTNAVPSQCAGGMYYSDDNGLTWTKAFEGAFVIEAEIDPNNEARMTVIMGSSIEINGLNQGVYLTTDTGKSWVKLNNGLGNSNRTAKVLFDPVDTNIL